MLLGFPISNEPMLNALGIKNLLGQPQIECTNIDLGPKDTVLEVHDGISFTASISFMTAIGAFILIVAGIYYTKKKNRKVKRNQHKRRCAVCASF
jgi:hypothetical protein